MVLQPGEMSLHHVKLFHGSNANTSDDRRIGFAIRYLPTHVRQVVGAKDSALLVRGVDSSATSSTRRRRAPTLIRRRSRSTRWSRTARRAILYRGTDRAPR